MATIRTLTPTEAEQAVDWAAAEGWNPGLLDLDCFLAQDPGLFLGAFDGGAMVSVIAATRYDPGFGFIGFPGRVGMPPEITVIELRKA